MITNERYVESVFLAARLAWPQLEKVWDTPLYRTLRLIVADEHNAWAIDSKSLTKIPYSEVQHRNLPIEFMYFQDIQWPDGRPTIYVSIGKMLPAEEGERLKSDIKAVPIIFSIATHEAFHFFVQDDTWRHTSQDNNTRATLYPIQATARFYRNSIIRALYATLQGQPDALGHARYWFDLWKTMYAEDMIFIRKTDVYEGSARYVEVAAEIIAQGYDFNTDDFRRALITKLESKVNSVYTQSDSESYSIGILSGCVLDMKKMEWKSAAIEGTPPLEILLRDVSPINKEMDDKLVSEVNKTVEDDNKKVRTEINNFIKAFNSPDTLRVFVSSELSGSFTLNGGFFRTKDVPYNIMVGLSSSANWHDGNYILNNIVAAHLVKSITDSGNDGFIILYEGKIPAAINGRLILKTDSLLFDIPYPEKLDELNTIYLP